MVVVAMGLSGPRSVLFGTLAASAKGTAAQVAAFCWRSQIIDRDMAPSKDRRMRRRARSARCDDMDGACLAADGT